MSRIGKNPVNVPQGVAVEIKDGALSAKGKLGELKLDLPKEVNVTFADQKVLVQPNGESKKARMLWGTTRQLVNNVVQGVAEGFTVKLQINGVGYKAAMRGAELVLNLGYSHEVAYKVPQGVTITCATPTEVLIHGANRQQVGQVAAVIRSYRRPEPYKGKGIKYANETIRMKEGKKK